MEQDWTRLHRDDTGFLTGAFPLELFDWAIAIIDLGVVFILKYSLPLFGAWLAVSTAITFWAFRIEKERSHGIQS